MTREEEVLRSALHAAADSLEPAPDGLTRIRERLSAPRPLGITWLLALRAGLLLWLDPAGEWLDRHAGPVTRPLRAWFSAERPRHARRRPLWRRPAVAIAAVVVVAAAGGAAMSGLPSVISQGGTPASERTSGNPVPGTRGEGPNGSATPLPSSASTMRHVKGRASASPSPSCSPSPGQASPSATPSPTPSPTSSPSASPSPSANPTTPAPDVSPSADAANPQDSPDAGGASPAAGTQANSAARLPRVADGSPASPAASASPSC